MDMPEKIKVWLWLFSNKTVPVGEWSSSHGGEVVVSYVNTLNLLRRYGLWGQAYHIWTRCYKFVFQRQKLPCGEVMLNIWLELVVCLPGRYDSIQGELNEEKMAKYQYFY